MMSTEFSEAYEKPRDLSRGGSHFSKSHGFMVLQYLKILNGRPDSPIGPGAGQECPAYHEIEWLVIFCKTINPWLSI